MYQPRGKHAFPQRRGSRDECVGNLLNEERARHLPEAMAHKRSALGEAMRAGHGAFYGRFAL
jgi:hypothetical protein